MASNHEPDGKNSLLGEFLLALARAPEPVQEVIVLFGLKQMRPYSSTLIQPYPMMSHMVSLIERQGNGSSSDDSSGGRDH
jgi:hypothetical protein